MGSTLEHGIYLPSEGEKNCYQGLAGNWNKVDGALGDIAELKQSIESKFTKEIVTELPTEDINPYCIYMILKTDPETDNIYDEWVYINNNWEYLGNTKVDMTQYYTKQEVNELPAVASGVTATKVGNYDAHIANGDIHVTASDKSKWNTVALIKQLRLVNTQVGSATTIAFANIDDTNGIKVGDKCMDLDAKMFEITAVDTTNQTVTVGTALIDLALDGNVVHTSGNETVGGEKTFANNKLIVGRNTDTGSAIQFVNADVVGDSANGSSGFEVYGSSISDANKIGSITIGEFSNNGGSYATIECNRTVSGVKSSNAIRSLIRPNGLKELSATVDNDCKLGTEFLRWSKIYGTEYYYGSNNVEFSTKFVTTDTNQTISGAKTFSEDVVIGNSDTTQNSKRLVITSSKVNLGDNNSDSWGISFNAGSSYSALINSKKSTSSTQDLQFTVRTKDTNNALIIADYRFRILTDGTATIEPTVTDYISLGSSANKWKDVQTKLINGLTPSSLSMPVIDRTKYVDISGYFTNTGNGDINTYPVTANGWIYLRLSNISGCQAEIYDSSNNRLYAVSTSGSIEQIMIPVVSGITFQTQWATGSTVTVNIARFIPCQGNI